jgi:DNA modification methylase
MPVAEQVIHDDYALYLGDSCEVLLELPDSSVHLSCYSPPFATDKGGALYHYSSSERDLSNCDSYPQFWKHYAYIIRELARVTMPGRITAVHCTDIPSGNSGNDHLTDFPGDIIRAHQDEGWHYIARYAVWKEPFAVRMRTLAKGLAHQTIVQDAARCQNASADYLLVFRRRGDSGVPIEHPHGLREYAGERQIPADLYRYRNWTGKQTENRLSHWIWRQYASAFWDDVRLDRVLPYKPARDQEDERHVHPLQLDVIERAVVLWSNPRETVLTPFMGVGSEVYGAVLNDRRAIGVELKPSYFSQAVKNCDEARISRDIEQAPLLADLAAES